MNRLALRLGLFGGCLAFAGSALIMFNADPTFRTRTSAQLLQMSLMWFGFTALVGGLVGWALWAVTGSRPQGASAGGQAPAPGRSQVEQAYAAAARGGLAESAPAPGAEAGGRSQAHEEIREQEALSGVPPEQAAQAIRSTLQRE